MVEGVAIGDSNKRNPAKPLTHMYFQHNPRPPNISVLEDFPSSYQTPWNFPIP